MIRVSFSITGRNIAYPTCIWVGLTRVDQLDAERLLQSILAILQSNRSFEIDDTLVIEFTHIDMPYGKGHRNRVGIMLVQMLGILFSNTKKRWRNFNSQVTILFQLPQMIRNVYPEHCLLVHMLQ